MALTNHRPFPGLLLAELALLLLPLSPPLAAAQSSNAPYGDGPYGGGYNVHINPAIASLVVAFICGFFFLGFFSVYLRNCGSRGEGNRPSGAAEAGAAHRTARRGLDPELLASFPTMAYAEAKKHNKGKDALECAVCLSEFSDDDSLRLLPACCHVFHVGCIDAWLDTHVTCPVCRANLADPAATATAGACEPPSAENPAVTEEPDLEAGRPPMEYRRWHSTGHEGEVVDRHTLRLPEHVRREIFTAARLRRAASVVEPQLHGEESGSRGHGGGLSGGWGFLLRTFSVRRRADAAAEGPSKRIFPTSDAPLALGKKPESETSETGVVGVGSKSESSKEKKKVESKSEVAKEAEAEAEAVSSSAKSAASQVMMERV